LPLQPVTQEAIVALVNKVWRESRFVPPGGEPGLVTGRPYVELPQHETITLVARQRFPFPSVEHPDFKTYVNQPDHSVGIRAGNDLLFPDIVVMNSSTTEVEMLAEVETARTLRQDDTIEKWRAFTGAGPLYLFVPMSQLERARALLKPLSLRLAGLRVYKINQGQKKLEVVETGA
jgi:hypothetical protein